MAKNTTYTRARINIIGRKGSKTCKLIVQEAGIARYTGKSNNADFLVNFGLAGDKQKQFFKRFPSARNIPTINKHVGYSKLNVINRAKRDGIEVPDSKLSLSKTDNKADWIEKKFNSVGGIGIRQARGRNTMAGKYYQRFVKDRSYELRVHAFLWMDEYRVQKRMGQKGEIAWNFKNGGTFMTIHNPKRYRVFEEAIQVSNKVLKMLGMSFGAVDFIVTKDFKLLFLEVNSAPGVSGLSDQIYVDAFKKLKTLSKKELNKYSK